jgi:sulfate permease, SulP family
MRPCTAVLSSRFIPGVELARTYRRSWLRGDLSAGLTTAAVVIPKAMAYATIAGLPLQVGLYTVLVPMVLYALLGTSRPLSVSTTTTIAILVATELSRAVPGGDAGVLVVASATLAILTGAILVAASVLRLGFVANFISEPVLTGFKSAIGLVIVVDQLPKLLGIHIEKTGFFRDIISVARNLPQASMATVAISVCLIVLLFGLQRFAPRWPAPLVAVAVATCASGLLGLGERGVAVVGSFPSGLPHLVWARFDLFEEMWPAAAGIALMSFTETIAAARAFRMPGEPRPEPNQELLAIGLANVAGGFLGAMPAGGGTTQTAVNRKAGAQTQLAELATAAAAVLALLLLGPILALMPQALLAAIVVVYSFELIRPSEFAAIRRVRRTEFAWALVALVGVVLLGTLTGILVAVIVSLLSLAQQAYNPPVYEMGRRRGSQIFRPLTTDHPDDETWAGLLILRTEGRLFFANAQHVADVVRPFIDRIGLSVVVFDCSAVIDIEYTAVKMLVEAEEKLRDKGIALWLAALNLEVLAVVRRSQLGETLGNDRMFSNLEAAVRQFERLHPGTDPCLGRST